MYMPVFMTVQQILINTIVRIKILAKLLLQSMITLYQAILVESYDCIMVQMRLILKVGDLILTLLQYQVPVFLKQ